MYVSESQLRDWHIAVLYNLMICGIMESKFLDQMSWAQAQAGDIVRALAISRSRDQVSPSHRNTHTSPRVGAAMRRAEHCWSRGLLPDTSKDDLLIPHARAAAVVSSCLHGLNSQAFLVANDTAYIHSRSYCPTLRVAPTQHSRTRSLSTRVWLCCFKVNGPL